MPPIYIFLAPPNPPPPKTKPKNPPLSLINIILRLNLFNPNLHALLPKADVLLLHLLARLIRDISHNGIDRETDETHDGEAEEEED